MKGMSTWLARFSPAANPIVVKESRQMVRNRFVVVAMLLYLLLLIVVTGIFLASHVNAARHGGQNFTLGRELCQFYLSVLTMVTLLFVPFYMAIRMGSERSGINMDLFHITTLSPGSIVRGKLLTGAMLALLFYSLTLPFMGLSFLLRGVDVPSILQSAGWSFGFVLLATMLGIFLGTVPMTPVLRMVVCCILGVIAVPSLIAVSLAGSHGWLARGGLVETSCIILLIALGLGLFYALAVSCLHARTSNFARPVRIYLSCCWVIGLGFALWARFTHGVSAAVEMFAAMSLVLLALGVPFVVSEPDTLSWRMRREAPVRFWQRCLAFPFSTGMAAGLLWTLLMAMISITLFGFHLLRPGHGRLVGNEEAEAFSCIFLYALFYALVAAWMRRRWLSTRIPVQNTWVVALVVAAVVNGGTAIALVIFGAQLGSHESTFLPGNFFVLHRQGYRSIYLIIGVIVDIGLLLLNANVMRNQFRQFKPLEADEK